MIHVGAAVRVDARQQRGSLRQFVQIIPVDAEPRGARDRDQMQRVVGRTAGRGETDHCVDDRFLVDGMAQRSIIAAERRDPQRLFGGGHRQRIAQRRVRIDECAARHVQAHDFHQHLIGVGGAVERAGARAVVGRGLRFQQFVARGLAVGETLAHSGFFLVRQPRRHGPGGHEEYRQMTEAQRADQQTRHDLVAHAQQQRRVEHLVRQRHRGGQRDGVAREQRQLHAGTALGDTVAHRRHAACDLGTAACVARGHADQRWVVLHRLMRRQHVVVRSDDADVAARARLQHRLVAARRGECVGEVAAAQLTARGRIDTRGVDARQILFAAAAAAFGDACGHAFNDGMKTHDLRGLMDMRECLAFAVV